MSTTAATDEAEATEPEEPKGPSVSRRLLIAMHPAFLTSRASGIAQVALKLVYPGWLLLVVVAAAAYYLLALCVVILYPVVMLVVFVAKAVYYLVCALLLALLWPFNAWGKKKAPAEPAAQPAALRDA